MFVYFRLQFQSRPSFFAQYAGKLVNLFGVGFVADSGKILRDRPSVVTGAVLNNNRPRDIQFCRVLLLRLQCSTCHQFRLLSLMNFVNRKRKVREVAGDIVRTLPAYTFHRCVALLVPIAFVSLHPEQV